MNIFGWQPSISNLYVTVSCEVAPIPCESSASTLPKNQNFVTTNTPKMVSYHSMVEGKKEIKKIRKYSKTRSKHNDKIPYDGLFCFDELAVTSDLDSRLGCFQINEQ